MYFGDGYYMVGMHAFWWLFWMIVLVMLVLALRPGANRRGERQRETPHDILRRRLANGEIKPEEYEQLKQVLDRSP